MMQYYPHGKRGIDLVLCLLVLPLAVPLVTSIAFISGVVYRRQVIYKHLRPGYKGRPFVFYKFSTLLPEEERNGKPLTDGERQTSWGKFLRDYSLDELPQLLNILKGDMSWVGPRPLLMEYLPHYTPEEARRHWVRPGLTGLAQIMGRNEISWKEKMAYDLTYVAKVSLLLDIKILFKTVSAVLAGQRINFGRRSLVAAPGARKPENSPTSSSFTTDKAV